MIATLTNLFQRLGRPHFWYHWQVFWFLYCLATCIVSAFEKHWIWVILNLISTIANGVGAIYWKVKCDLLPKKI